MNATNKDEEETVRIEKFEKLAHELLQPTKKDTLWQTQMAMICAQRDLTGEAIKRSELALEMDPSNWRASVCRARLASPSDAIEILQTVIDRQEKDTNWMKDPAHVKDLGDLNYELAEKHWKNEQFDLAFPIYASSFKQAPQHPRRISGVLRRFKGKSLYSEVISLIEEISTIESGKYAAELVMKTRDWIFLELLDDAIRNSAIATNQYGILETLYEPAIRMGEKTDDQEMLCFVRYLYARALTVTPRGVRTKSSNYGRLPCPTI